VVNEKFETIITDYQGLLYRLCYAYLDNKWEIEDLLQEIYINIWNNIEKFRGEAKISTWIYRIGVNTILMYKRSEKKKQHGLEVYKSEMHLEADEKYDEEEKLNKLKQCINQLANSDRILVSFMLEGLTYEEIADVLGITLNNVGVKINRVKKRLTKLMEDLNHE